MVFFLSVAVGAAGTVGSFPNECLTTPTQTAELVTQLNEDPLSTV